MEFPKVLVLWAPRISFFTIYFQPSPQELVGIVLIRFFIDSRPGGEVWWDCDSIKEPTKMPRGWKGEGLAADTVFYQIRHADGLPQKSGKPYWNGAGRPHFNGSFWEDVAEPPKHTTPSPNQQQQQQKPTPAPASAPNPGNTKEPGTPVLPSGLSGPPAPKASGPKNASGAAKGGAGSGGSAPASSKRASSAGAALVMAAPAASPDETGKVLSVENHRLEDELQEMEERLVKKRKIYDQVTREFPEEVSSSMGRYVVELEAKVEEKRNHLADRLKFEKNKVRKNGLKPRQKKGAEKKGLLWRTPDAVAYPKPSVVEKVRR